MIKQCLIYLIAAIIGLFIQASLIHSSFPAAPAPDLIVVLVISLAIMHRSIPGVFGAFFLGVLADLASGQYLGPNAAGCLTAFGIVAVLASRVFADHAVAMVFITFFCSLAKSMVVMSMYSLYLNESFFRAELLELALWEAGLSALVAPVVLRLMLNGRRPSSVSRAGAAGSFRWSHEVK